MKNKEKLLVVYTKGFLTGIGHMLICMIMIIINAVSIPIIMNRSYKKNIIEDNEGDGGSSFLKTVFYTLSISIIVQISLNILIENPFKDPELPNLLM